MGFAIANASFLFLKLRTAINAIVRKKLFFSNLKYNKAQGLLILVVQKLQTFLRHFILIGQAGGIWLHQLFFQFEKKLFLQKRK